MTGVLFDLVAGIGCDAEKRERLGGIEVVSLRFEGEGRTKVLVGARKAVFGS